MQGFACIGETMIAWLGKTVIKAVVSVANTWCRSALTYQTGLEARKWIESHVLSKLDKWAKKSTNKLDDGLAAYVRGVLKSQTLANKMKAEQ